jgi:heme ABC exporter ATP-binding subunit CcmA
MNHDYCLEVTGASKHYSGVLLFKDICFSLYSGEVLAVTGWNGSGKSTLLRILAGLVRLSAGKVEMYFQNELISKESRRRYLGMVAPALSLYGELTALENMKFFYNVRGLPFNRSSCLALLERVGLIQHIHETSGKFSSGMQQRLKLAQAILHSPPLLLLDEPGCNLDSKGMEVVEDLIETQRQNGMTVIASNEKREVAYADRVINLSA